MQLPQLLAGLDVKKRHDEESGGEQQHDDVLHRESPVWRPAAFQVHLAAGQPEMILAHKQIKYRKDFLRKA
jgi:hypothetical protein